MCFQLKDQTVIIEYGNNVRIIGNILMNCITHSEDILMLNLAV